MTIGDFQRGLLSLLAIALFALVAHIESACGQGNFFPAQSPMVNDLLNLIAPAGSLITTSAVM